MQSPWRAALLLLLVGAVGCDTRGPAVDRGSTTAPPTQTATGRVIGRTPLALGGMTWANGRLIVEVARGYASRLGSFDPSSGTLDLFPALSDPSCYRLDAASPVVVEDDRVGVVLSCSSRSTGGWQNSLGILDPRTGGVERLPNSEMTIDGDPIELAGIVTMDADGAVISAGDDACGSLFTLDPRGVRAIDLSIGTSSAWSLATYFERGFQGPKCEQLGVAFWPTLSPDGRRVAFAAKDIAGLNGVEARLYTPSQILIADRAWTHATEIASGIRDLTNLTWSPRGDWIAFTGLRNGVQGIWLVSDSGHVVLLEQMDAFSIAWAPDGTSLVAVERAAALEGPSRILRFDDLPEPT